MTPRDKWSSSQDHMTGMDIVLQAETQTHFSSTMNGFSFDWCTENILYEKKGEEMLFILYVLSHCGNN